MKYLAITGWGPYHGGLGQSCKRRVVCADTQRHLFPKSILHSVIITLNISFYIRHIEFSPIICRNALPIMHWLHLHRLAYTHRNCSASKHSTECIATSLSTTHAIQYVCTSHIDN